MAERGVSTVRAAIDVGSNSVKLLVAEVSESRITKVLAERSAVTALAGALDATQTLDLSKAEASIQKIVEFSLLARELGAEEIAVAGTSALRDATNAGDFAQRVHSATGLRLRILGGEEEAELGRRAAIADLPPDWNSTVFFDVGGGSTELTLLRSGQVLRSVSLQLGARRVTLGFKLHQPVPADLRAQVGQHIAQLLLEQAADLKDGSGQNMAGLGGTAVQIVRLLSSTRAAGGSDATQAFVRLEELAELVDKVSGLTERELLDLPGIDPARASVLFAGASIILGLVMHFGASGFLLIDRGLRYGLLLEASETV